jgi:hypothetical protein
MTVARPSRTSRKPERVDVRDVFAPDIFEPMMLHSFCTRSLDIRALNDNCTSWYLPIHRLSTPILVHTPHGLSM